MDMLDFHFYGLGHSSVSAWQLLDVGVMFVCVFKQRACLIANFNAARSLVANQEVRLSRLSTVGFHPLGSSTVKW